MAEKTKAELLVDIETKDKLIAELTSANEAWAEQAEQAEDVNALKATELESKTSVTPFGALTATLGDRYAAIVNKAKEDGMLGEDATEDEIGGVVAGYLSDAWDESIAPKDPPASGDADKDRTAMLESDNAALKLERDDYREKYLRLQQEVANLGSLHGRVDNLKAPY